MILSSCDRPDCVSTNQVFNEFSSDSKEYKAELLSIMEDDKANKLEYWFEEYQQKSGKEYILVKAQNKKVCAEVLMAVNDWAGIEGIRKTKGKGYRGARLSGLSFSVDEGKENIEFIFNDVDKVVD